MMGRSQRSYKPEPEPTTANNWRVLAIADAELIGKQTKAKQAEKDKIRDWSDEEAFTYGRQRLGRTNGRVTQEETEGLITEALGGGGENE